MDDTDKFIVARAILLERGIQPWFVPDGKTKKNWCEKLTHDGYLDRKKMGNRYAYKLSRKGKLHSKKLRGEEDTA